MRQVSLSTPGVTQGHGVTVTQDGDQELCGQTRGHTDTVTCLVSQQSAAEDTRHAILSFVLKLKFVGALHIYLLFDYNFPSGKELVLTRIWT